MFQDNTIRDLCFAKERAIMSLRSLRSAECAILYMKKMTKKEKKMHCPFVEDAYSGRTCQTTYNKYIDHIKSFKTDIRKSKLALLKFRWSVCDCNLRLSIRGIGSMLLGRYREDLSSDIIG